MTTRHTLTGLFTRLLRPVIEAIREEFPAFARPKQVVTVPVTGPTPAAEPVAVTITMNLNLPEPTPVPAVEGTPPPAKKPRRTRAKVAASQPVPQPVARVPEPYYLEPVGRFVIRNKRYVPEAATKPREGDVFYRQVPKGKTVRYEPVS